jgi:multiple sugar transport system substrate-binding protein
MKEKKALVFLVVFMLFSVLAFSAGTKEETKEANVTEDGTMDTLSGTVSVWTWASQESRQKVIEAFNVHYPDVTIEFVAVQAADMPMKVQTALASGSEIGDVIWSEMAVRGVMLELDCWEDLEADPYNLPIEDFLEFDAPLSRTPDGKLVGVNTAPSIGGLAYKRDLALEYFGTDDPIKLSEMFPTWDSIIKAGKQLKIDSKNEVYAFSTLAEISDMLKGLNTQPLIIGDTLNLTAAFGPVFDKLLAFRRAGLVDDLDMWSPAWSASFSKKTNMFNFCPAWAPTWVFKSNADPSTSGNWGVMRAPEGGYMAGGTNTFIPVASDNKMAAFAWVKFQYMSEEGATLRRDLMDNLTSYKPIYNDPDFFSKPDDFFGGQDVVKFFAQEVIPNTSATRPVSKYDIEINDAFAIALKTINETDGAITSKELIAKMQKEIIAKSPDLKPEP